jgi:lysophospholipase L1-like esterase
MRVPPSRVGRRAALVAALCCLAHAAPAAGQVPGSLYVALGDSYTSGPLVPNQHGEPIDCARSDRNYPSVVAAGLGLTLRDVSCGSAQTRHMQQPQAGLPLGGTNPPQFDAVTPDAALVTVGIGGNDAGLVGVAEMCAQLGVTDPAGSACRTHYAENGSDEVRARIAAAAPKVAAVLQGIRRRAPDARVAIVGYPAVAPTDGTGCYPLVPMSSDDLAYINELLIAINAMIAQQAAANDAEFVDTFGDSVGHHVCTLPPTRWYEGLVPTEPAFPLHPNAKGEASMGRSVIALLRRPAPARVARLSALQVVRAAVPVGPPARVAYTLDRPAQVGFTVRRVVGGRTGRALATFTRTGAAGLNRVSLTRRMLGRAGGRYRLTATPAGGRPVPVLLVMRRP